MMETWIVRMSWVDNDEGPCTVNCSDTYGPCTEYEAKKTAESQP